MKEVERARNRNMVKKQNSNYIFYSIIITRLFSYVSFSTTTILLQSLPPSSHYYLSPHPPPCAHASHDGLLVAGVFRYYSAFVSISHRQSNRLANIKILYSAPWYLPGWVCPLCPGSNVLFEIYSTFFFFFKYLNSPF